MPLIDQLLSVLVSEGASDLHFAEGQPPKMRQHGDMIPLRDEPITRDEALKSLSDLCGQQRWEAFEERGDLDFAYEKDEQSRFLARSFA